MGKKKDKNLTKKSGGNRKKLRNRAKCEQYRRQNRRERNRDRRVARIERSLERAASKRSQRRIQHDLEPVANG